MQPQATTRHHLPLLAVLATCCLGLFACSQADQNGAAEPPPAPASSPASASSGVPTDKTVAPESPAPRPADRAAAEEQDVPTPLPREVVKAWTDAGAELCWMQKDQHGFASFRSRQNGQVGAVPAF